MRNLVKNAEKEMRTGGKIDLDFKEQKADEFLIRLKQNEIQKGILDTQNQAPWTKHFFQAKLLINEGKISLRNPI
jgi:Fe-S cluster biosynthesis and repair protein YggX